MGLNFHLIVQIVYMIREFINKREIFKHISKTYGDKMI